MNQDFLNLSQDCRDRLLLFQIDCQDHMSIVRNVVDDETYQILSRGQAVAGNAAREIGLLMAEVRKLREELDQK